MDMLDSIQVDEIVMNSENVTLTSQSTLSENGRAMGALRSTESEL
jgi:hypothetical protein